MVTFHIVTLFPDALEGYFDASILKRAQKKKLIKIKTYDIRKFAGGRHRITDDRPFGGGPGMVMKAEPIVKAIHRAVTKPKLQKNKTKIIVLSPSGKQFTQTTARGFAKKYNNIVLVCGHYEGIDGRVKKIVSDLGFGISDFSVGPYILTGGELAAMVVADAVSRHVPGVLGKIESLEEEKGSYPVYTRPESIGFKGKKYGVPKVLLSGDHKKIGEWRRKNKFNLDSWSG